MENFDLENPLTSFKEHQADTLPSLFADESLHMPSLPSNGHLFPSSFRQDAISLISELSYDMDPFIPYLAVNYMDRLISKREIPQGKPWILRLLVISCLSLAAKMMKNTELPLSNFQGEAPEGCICDTQAINRMEVIILTTLKWRMRSITPFSFLYFFLSLLNLDEPCFSRAIKDGASEILFASQCEIKLLGYKPSVIAASAILCASNELFPLQYDRFVGAISTCENVNKGSLEECLGIMRDTKADTYKRRIGALPTSTVTPISVLDPQCPTSGTESTSEIPEGDPTVTNDIIKRRKLNGFLGAPMFQKVNAGEGKSTFRKLS